MCITIDHIYLYVKRNSRKILESIPEHKTCLRPKKWRKASISIPRLFKTAMNCSSARNYLLHPTLAGPTVLTPEYLYSGLLEKLSAISSNSHRSAAALMASPYLTISINISLRLLWVGFKTFDLTMYASDKW